MPMWDPWRGCRRCSEGCLHCYIHKGDAKRGVDTGNVIKTEDFYKPVERLKNGGYKMKPGLVYLGFSTDFLIEEADIREQCVRKRVDFEFRQCGTHFIKDGRQYKLQTKDLCRQARLAGINCTFR